MTEMERIIYDELMRTKRFLGTDYKFITNSELSTLAENIAVKVRAYLQRKGEPK